LRARLEPEGIVNVHHVGDATSPQDAPLAVTPLQMVDVAARRPNALAHICHLMLIMRNRLIAVMIIAHAEAFAGSMTEEQGTAIPEEFR
jgi:hypothetical protein